MLIPTACPHCRKAYKVKGEFAGKTVKCPNPDCRKPMPVPIPRTAADADTEALKALADEPQENLDERTIPLVCDMCSHAWAVPWAMQGKNVLCPDCRHRNKVPMQKVAKAADWKTGGNRPSMARVEELDGVIASTDVGRVSGEALQQAGVVRTVYESRRPAFWMLAVGLPLLVLVGLVSGIGSLSRGRSDARELNHMKVALGDADALKDAPLAPAEKPLFAGALAVAAGEYLARQDDPARLKEALTQFARGRGEIDGAAASAGRTYLLMELAVAQLALGGSDEQAGAGTRLRWSPASAGRARLNEKQFTVQEEVAATLSAVSRPDKLVSLADRQTLARRLVRGAAAAGQPAGLDPAVPKLFTDAEAADGQALAALEALRATGNTDAARQRAAELAGTGGGGPFLQALALVVGPVPGLPAPNPVPAGQVPGDAARQTHVAAHLLKKEPDAALELAARGKGPDTRGSRGLALALVADWADDPKPAVLAAADIVEGEGKPKSSGMPDSTLVRLAGAAGRAGLADKAELFVKAVDKDDARAWAAAEAARGRFQATPTQPPDDAVQKVPENDKEHRSGVAWQLLLAARQAGRVGAGSPTTYDRWGAGTFKPFGYAGLALGLQDNKSK